MGGSCQRSWLREVCTKRTASLCYVALCRIFRISLLEASYCGVQISAKKETKYRLVFGFFLNPNGLDCAVNFTGTQATGANVQAFNRTFNNCSYLLNIRVPSTFGVSIGVADVVASEFSFTADFADRCHCFPPP